MEAPNIFKLGRAYINLNFLTQVTPFDKGEQRPDRTTGDPEYPYTIVTVIAGVNTYHSFKDKDTRDLYLDELIKAWEKVRN